MPTVAAWIAAHPPPPTLTLGDDAPPEDGPYRGATGPIVIRAVGPRALVEPGEVPPLRPPPPPPPATRIPWRWKARGLSAVTTVGGLVVSAVAIGGAGRTAMEWGIGLCVAGAAMLISTLDLQQRPPPPPRRRPCVVALYLDGGDVQLKGATPLRLALVDLRAFEQHDDLDELRVKRRGEQGPVWPTLWIGPAAERRWIEALVELAVAEARATAAPPR
jgi:hypothetical protein